MAIDSTVAQHADRGFGKNMVFEFAAFLVHLRAQNQALDDLFKAKNPDFIANLRGGLLPQWRADSVEVGSTPCSLSV